MAKDSKLIRVGITHGDINGIGYEVIMKALMPEGITELMTPVIFGSPSVANYYKKACGLEDFRALVIPDASQAEAGQINLVDIAAGELKVEPGQATAEAGAAALKALDAATQALLDGSVDVLVTAPINKEAMKMAGFPFPGHTEYLEERLGDGYKAVMLLCREHGPRVGLVTVHLPMTEVAAAVTREGIVEKLRSLHHTLRKDFAIERPTIAVLALNPHAGDGGAIGSQEAEVIAPAIAEAYAQKIMAFGPYAADGFFGSRAFEKYDAVLAMYHDQGLIPFKMLAMEDGVNFTSSLPYVRTSPDHGTGFDIVTKGVADPSSMRAAIYAAIDIYRRRRNYIRSKSNPLRKQYVDRSGDKVTIDMTKDDDNLSLCITE